MSLMQSDIRYCGPDLLSVGANGVSVIFSAPIFWDLRKI